jgi:hypothetical protein
MKYLITESQLDRTIFRYLDNQDFIQVEKKGGIYFVNSDDDKYEDNEYAQIKYDKKNGWCNIRYTLINDISSLFSMDESDCRKVIGSWVEKTLQVMVITTFSPIGRYPSKLMLPSN